MSQHGVDDVLACILLVIHIFLRSDSFYRGGQQC